MTGDVSPDVVVVLEGGYECRDGRCGMWERQGDEVGEQELEDGGKV